MNLDDSNHAEGKLFHVKQVVKIDSREMIDRYCDRATLTAFLDQVWEGNRRFNLFSRRSQRSDLVLLAAESLLPVHWGWIGKSDGPILDIGSGWGIPAIPIILACPEIAITMAERSQKKADFLLLLLNRLNINATVINAELQALMSPLSFRTVTMRRVALDAKVVTQIRRLTAPPAARA